jgi:WD40 repeat protein
VPTPPPTEADVLQHNQASLDELRTVLRREAGEFSLTLAACNYHYLRQVILEDFQARGEIAVVRLPGRVPSLLAAMQTQLGDRIPAAVMVTGLEAQDDLPALLKGANLARDELRKALPCPVVLWVNETVRQQFMRLAPDLRSFSPSPITFTLPQAALIHALEAGTTQLFVNMLEYEGDRDLSGTTTIRLKGSALLRSELEFGLQDLTEQGWQPDPDLAASLDFLRGREAHSRLEMEAARSHYEASLAHWQDPTVQRQQRQGVPSALDREAVLLLHLGLWWRSMAVLQRATYQASLRQARRYFQDCLTIFREEDQRQRLARFIHVLAEVLQKQRDWDSLETLVVEGITLHQETGDPIRLARDHGFLAEVALIREDWLTAQQEAALALTLLEDAAREAELEPRRLLSKAVQVADRFQRGWYRFLLGQAQMHLKDPKVAIAYLEAARWETDPEVDLTLHRQVLEELIGQYFQQGQYWEAFDIKQALRQVEYRYNLRAFIGAGAVQPHSPMAMAMGLAPRNQAAVAAEIRASGRLPDVEALLHRLEDSQRQIIIIHGPSGVGKSSILTAGLLPALGTLYPAGHTTLPLLVQTYGTWPQTIAKALAAALTPWEGPPDPDAPLATDLATLQETLRQGVTRNNCFFVFLFDQFEEFFFEEKSPEERRSFYEFLQFCIDQPWVKVVLTLREDYLHHLLEVERVVNQIGPMTDLDLLSRAVRYPLGNFSPAAAEAVIRQLTEAAQYPLEEALIHRLVADLAAPLGSVRPIELQVVGAQLQRETIDTLAQYEALGDSPKETLVQRFLAYVVRDCGPPNERLAWVVLYLLTDEDRDQRLYRPLRTREELEYELALLEMPFDLAQLDLVMSILVGSGLVFAVPEEPEDRYQLVHDYLVSYVRQVQTPGLMAELQAARAEAEAAAVAKKLAEEERDSLAEANAVLEAANAEADQVVRSAQRKAQIFGAGSIAAVALAAVSSALISLRANDVQQRAYAQQAASLRDVKVAERQANQDVARSSDQVDFGDWQLTRAQDKVTDAEVAVETAEAELVAVQGQSAAAIAQAEEKVTAAEASLTTAQGELKNVEGQRQQAAVERDKAIAEQDRAQSGVRLEQAGLAALRRFEDDSFEALFLAAKATEGLNKLLRPTDTWATYPAFSPGFTLQTSLDLGREIHRLEGHTDWVLHAAFSNDGSRVVTASSDGTARVWNLSTGEFQPLEGHTDWVRHAAFSNDGSRVVTASDDGTARVWNLATGEAQTLAGHTSEVLHAAFSNDGSRVVTASDDGTARVWNLSTGEFQPLAGHTSVVRHSAFSNDGSRVVTASDDGTARVWNLSTGEFQPLAGHTSVVRHSAFSNDGSRVVTASDDGTARVWNLSTGEFQPLEGHTDWVRHAAFSNDGSRVVTASDDGTARVWNLSTGEFQPLEGHTDWVRHAAFSNDGSRVVTASDDGTARVWNLSTGEFQPLEGHTDWVRHAAFSNDGSRVVTASNDGTARVWNLSTGEFQPLEGHTFGVLHAAFSNDGSRVVTASVDGTARVWNLSTGEFQPLEGHAFGVLHAAFSNDGSRVVTASNDGTARVWNLATGEAQTLAGHAFGVLHAAFSNDGSRVVTASVDGTVRVWNLSTGEFQPLEGHTDWVRHAAFSNDGSRVVTASNDGTVRVWNLSTGEFQPLAGHTDWVRHAAFSNDGSRVVTASDDGTARVWNLSTGEFQPLEGHTDWVLHAAFSNDGSRVVTASNDGTARVWNLSTGEAQTLEGHTSRVNHAAFSNDDSRVVTFGRDTTRIWTLEGQQLAEYPGRGLAVNPTFTRVTTTQETSALIPEHSITVWRIDDIDNLLIRACQRLRPYILNAPDLSDSDRALCDGIPNQLSDE